MNQTPKAASIKPLLHKDMEVDVIDYRTKPLHIDLPSCPTVTISTPVTNQKIDILATWVWEALRILFTIPWAQLSRMASNSTRILSTLRDVEIIHFLKHMGRLLISTRSMILTGRLKDKQLEVQPRDLSSPCGIWWLFMIPRRKS